MIKLIEFYYRATLCWRGICCRRVSVHSSVCLSQVESPTKMAKPRITQTMSYDSSGSGLYSFPVHSFPVPKISAKLERDHPKGGAK